MGMQLEVDVASRPSLEMPVHVPYLEILLVSRDAPYLEMLLVQPTHTLGHASYDCDSACRVRQ